MAGRTVLAFFLAWVLSVLMGFFAGCVVVLFWVNDHWHDVLALLSGDEEATGVMFFVGINTAFVAAIVAAIAELCVVVPLHLVFNKFGYRSLRVYIFAGVVTSIIVCAVFLVLEKLVYSGSPLNGLWFPFLAVIVICPVAVALLWIIARPDHMGTKA